jgi:hypothetical protein
MQNYNDFDEWLKLRKKQKLSYVYKEVDKISKGFARNY